MGDQVGQQDVFATREGIGIDAGQAEQAGDETFDFITECLGILVPGQLRGGQRTDDVEWYPGLGAGGVDGELGAVPQGAHLFAAEVP